MLEHRRTLAATALVAASIGLSLFGYFSFHSYHLDDWTNLGYVSELGGTGPNLSDPYMGTDEPIISRLGPNLTTWAYFLGSQLFGIEPAEFYHTWAPPFLLAGSVIAVFVMLRAVGFRPLYAAAGCFFWVLYFAGSSFAGRSPGAFFFDRIAQDKALLWLVLSPLVLASLCVFFKQSHTGSTNKTPASRLPESGLLDRRQAILAVAISVLLVLATLVHPLACIFGAAFIAALLAEWIWRHRRMPSAQRVGLSVAMLIPCLLVALALRLTVANEDPGNYRTRGPEVGLLGFEFSDFSGRRFAEIGGWLITDPAFIAVLNLTALVWLAWALWMRRRTFAVGIAAALYLISATVFVPWIPNLITPITSANGVWRFTWLMPIACTIALTDLSSWILSRSPDPARVVWGAILTGSMVAMLTLFALEYERLTPAGSGGPDESQLAVMARLERMVGDESEVVVLANNRLSRFIPAYTHDVSVVAFPQFAHLRAFRADGRLRGDANERLARTTDIAGIVDEMRFWSASFLVVDSRDRSYDALREDSSGELLVCYDENDFLILALKPETCPTK